MKVIDISNNKISLKNLDLIINAIIENGNYEQISLKGISVLRITEREEKEYNEKVNLGISENRTRYFAAVPAERYNLIVSIC